MIATANIWTGAFLGLILLIAACGGGEETPPADTPTATPTPTPTVTPSAAATPSPTATATAAGGGEELTLEEYFQQVQATFDDMSDIDPPADVEDAHNELLVAVTDLAEAYADLDVESLSGLGDLLSQLLSPGLIEATERLLNACSELQGIASDNSIDLDLACSGDNEVPAPTSTPRAAGSPPDQPTPGATATPTLAPMPPAVPAATPPPTPAG